MNDHQIAASLRAKSPGALAELFDVYGDRLFRYCWFMLRHRDIAQIALRDTFVVAEAHIARLADPDLLGPWLYSLARAECRRRRPVQPSLADEPPARPGRGDADPRLMAWNAATSMAPDDLEALDIACRHDVDLSLVLGVPAGEVQALLDRARQHLEQALAAEILVSRGGRGCPDWAEVMSGWTGTMTPEMRARVLGHAADCAVCGPTSPRNVSAARVFALLPAPALTLEARSEVLGFFEEQRPSGDGDFPVNQASALAELGFPLTPEAASAPSVPGTGPGQPLPRPILAGRILAGVGAVTAAAVITGVFVLAGIGGKPVADRMTATAPSAASGAGAVLVRPAGTQSAAGADPGRPAVPPSSQAPVTGPSVANDEALITGATKPLPSPGAPALSGPAGSPGSGGSGSPSGLTPAIPPPAGTLAVSPGRVALGAGTTGQIVLTAAGGPVTWSASSSSAQVTLSSDEGTLQAGQSITLEVTVIRGTRAGTAVVSVESPASGSATVEVSWTPPAGNPRPGPDPSPTTPSRSPSPSPSTSPSPSPSTSASASADAAASAS